MKVLEEIRDAFLANHLIFGLGLTEPGNRAYFENGRTTNVVSQLLELRRSHGNKHRILSTFPRTRHPPRKGDVGTRQLVHIIHG